MARKPRDKVGLVLRFSEALRRRIEKAAKANHWSMNAEIVGRLEASFRKEDWQASLGLMADEVAARTVFNAMPKIEAAAKAAAEEVIRKVGEGK